jgi:hypothetical protein
MEHRVFRWKSTSVSDEHVVFKVEEYAWQETCVKAGAWSVFMSSLPIEEHYVGFYVYIVVVMKSVLGYNAV